MARSTKPTQLGLFDLMTPVRAPVRQEQPVSTTAAVPSPAVRPPAVPLAAPKPASGAGPLPPDDPARILSHLQIDAELGADRIALNPRGWDACMLVRSDLVRKQIAGTLTGREAVVLQLLQRFDSQMVGLHAGMPVLMTTSGERLFAAREGLLMVPSIQADPASIPTASSEVSP